MLSPLTRSENTSPLWTPNHSGLIGRLSSLFHGENRRAGGNVPSTASSRPTADADAAWDHQKSATLALRQNSTLEHALALERLQMIEKPREP
jgi:hypothetical protein